MYKDVYLDAVTRAATIQFVSSTSKAFHIFVEIDELWSL